MLMNVITNYINLTKSNCKKVGSLSLAMLFLVACMGSTYIGLAFHNIIVMLVLIPVFLLIDILIMNALD